MDLFKESPPTIRQDNSNFYFHFIYKNIKIKNTVGLYKPSSLTFSSGWWVMVPTSCLWIPPPPTTLPPSSTPPRRPRRPQRQQRPQRLRRPPPHQPTDLLLRLSVVTSDNLGVNWYWSLVTSPTCSHGFESRHPRISWPFFWKNYTIIWFVLQYSVYKYTSVQ